MRRTFTPEYNSGAVVGSPSKEITACAVIGNSGTRRGKYLNDSVSAGSFSFLRTITRRGPGGYHTNVSKNFMRTILRKTKYMAMFIASFLLVGNVFAVTTTITSGSTVQASTIPTSNDVVIQGGGTLNMDVSRSFVSLTTSGSGTANITGSGVISLTSTAAGTVSIIAGTTLATVADINLAGDWLNKGTFTPNTTNVTFTGTAGIAIASGTGVVTTSFYNLTIANTNTVAVNFNTNVTHNLNINNGVGMLTLPSAVSFNSSGAQGTIQGTGGNVEVLNATGFFTQYKFTTYTLTSITVNYDLSGGTITKTSDLGGSHYGNITLKTGTKPLAGDIIIDGNLTFTSGTIDHTASNFGVQLGGNLINNGGAFSGNGVFTFNGSSQQTISGSVATVFTGLKIDNSSGVLVSNAKDVTASNFILNNGIMNVGANALIIAASGTASRPGTGHVNGSMQYKTIPTGTPSYTFYIGDATKYAPLTFTANVTGSGSTLTASTVGSDHPNILSSGLYVSRTVNRYWTFSAASISYNSGVITLTYPSSDVDAGATPANFIAKSYSASTWGSVSSNSPNSTGIQLTGVAFGNTTTDLAVGEPWNTSASGYFRSFLSGNWNSTATWQSSPDNVTWGQSSLVPTSSATSILIRDGHTVSIDLNSSASNLIVGEGASGILQYLDNATAKTFTISGNITVADNGQLISGTQTGTRTHSLIFAGTSLAIGTGATFNMVSPSTPTTRSVSTSFTSTSASDVTISSSGVPSLISFAAITLDRGSSSRKVVSSVSITTASGFTNLITYTNGTWEQSAGTFAFSGTGNQNLTANGNLSVTGSGSMVFGGSFIVSAGTFTLNSSGSVTVGSAAGDRLEPAGGAIILTGGTLNVATRIGSGTSEGTNNWTGTLTINGATVNVPSLAGSLSTTGQGVFGAPASGFTMSSGTLNILQANQGNNLNINDIRIEGGTINGGTIVIGSASPGSQNFKVRIVPAINNLTVNTGSILDSLATPLIINGNLVLASGTTFVPNVTLTIAGSSVSRTTGNIDASTANAEVKFSNTSNISLPANTFTGNIYKLTMNGSGGITLGSDVTVSNTLAFTSGVVTTGSNKIIIPSTGNVSGANSGTGWVAGNLQKNVATGSNVARTFEIGGANNYRPVNLTVASVSVAGDLTAGVTQVDGAHPQLGSSTLSTSKYIKRYWTLTNSGISFTTYDATFNFVAGDIAGGATTSNLLVGKYNAGWSYPTVGTRTATSTQATGVNAFSDFVLAETACTAPAVTTNPADQTKCSGQSVSFTAAASGTPTPTVQWQVSTDGGANYSDLSGETNTTLTFTTSSSQNGNKYRAVFTNTCNTATTTAATLTVNTAPGITCPSNITQANDAGQCSASVSFSATATGTPSPTVTYKIGATTITSPHVFPVGTTTVDVTASNSCSPDATCSFTVTVTDNENPTITCAAAQTQTADEGQCSAAVTVVGPTFGDNCPGSTVTNSFNGTSNASGTYPVGTTVVTWTVTDAHGHTNTCTQNITVTDDEGPTFSGVPSNTTADCANVPPAANVTASDCSGVNGDGVVYNESRTNGNCNGNYTLTRTWTATDTKGNQSTATQTITVTDTHGPVLTGVPANTTVECTNVPDPPVVTAADDCSGVNASGVVYQQTKTNGSCAGRYTLTRTWTATDNCGNPTTATQTITVTDTHAPDITDAAHDKTVECNGSGNTSQYNSWLNDHANANASDHGCSGVTWSDNSGTATWVNDCGNTRHITVTFTATDGCGQSSSTSATFRIEDHTAPSLHCPANVTMDCKNGNTTPANTGMATASDDCNAVTITYTDAVTGAEGNSYTITRTWKATDACGNARTCEQTIKVKDDKKPTITCPPDVTVSACTTGPLDPQVAPAQTGNPTVSDNCDPNPVITYTDSDNYDTKADRDKHYNYTITRKWKVTDANGNYATCDQQIKVQDNTIPTVNCPGNITVNANTGLCSATVNPGTATATDNCTPVAYIKVSGDRSDKKKLTDPYPVGVTTITWTAEDVVGNKNTCPQTITVVDTQNPVVTCPYTGPVIRYADNDKCSYKVKGKEFNATATDNCSIATLVYTISGATATPANGTNLDNVVFNKGVTNVSWTATDASGRTATCSFTVDVRDDQKPKVDCPGNVNTCKSPSGMYTIAPMTATDNCGGLTNASATYQVTGATTRGGTGYNASGNFSPGTSTVTWTVTDGSGNVGTCSMTVKISNTLCSVREYEYVDNNGSSKGKQVTTTPQQTIENAATSNAKTSMFSTHVFNVKVAPNPSVTDFRISVESSSTAPITIRVVDAVGRVLATISGVQANQPVSLGRNYIGGSYFAEVVQGADRKTVKLIKLN